MSKQKLELPEGMTVSELESLLAQKKKADQEVLERKRKKYEKRRENLLCDLLTKAFEIQQILETFKGESFEELNSFRDAMLEYGDLRGGEKNKGNFELKNDKYKVQFTTHVMKRFDERAEMAESRLKKFLKGFVKKRDKEVFEIVNALLERNEKNGDFDISLINRLYKMEDRFDDEDWKEGIRLFKEAYQPEGTKQYVRFYCKDEQGGWESVSLDFARIKIGG